MIRKIIEKLFWHYQEKDNWAMKMNEPIAIKKLTKEEAQIFLMKQRAKKKYSVNSKIAYREIGRQFLCLNL